MSLRYLCQKPASFEIFGCKYVCLYVYHRICLDFKYDPRTPGTHGNNKKLTAKPIAHGKTKSSRQNEKAHGKTKKLTAKPNNSRQKQKARGKTGTTGVRSSNLRDRYCETEILGPTPPADKMPSRTAEKDVIKLKSDELIFFDSQGTSCRKLQPNNEYRPYNTRLD